MFYNVESIPLKQHHFFSNRLGDVKLNQVMQRLWEMGTLTMLVKYKLVQLFGRAV